MKYLLTIALALLGFAGLILLSLVLIWVYAIYFVWLAGKEGFCGAICWWLKNG